MVAHFVRCWRFRQQKTVDNPVGKLFMYRYYAASKASAEQIA
jgi:hypothetical protein